MHLFRVWALLLLAAFSCGACPRRQGRLDYGREASRHLEREMVWQEGEQVFVAFELFGTDERRSGVTVYGWCLRLGFRTRDDQVIQEDAASLPLAVDFKRQWWSGRLLPTGIRQPQLGEDFEASAKALFPQAYWPRVLGETPAYLYADLRERVTAHYARRLKPGRFVRVEPPPIFSNAHRHADDIYGLLNQGSTYRRVRIEENVNRVPPPAAGGTVASPDGRYEAWLGAEKRPRLYIKDLVQGTVCAVVNPTSDWQSGLAWKEDNTLLFDQYNGINTFGDGESHGVHIEIHIPTRRIVWAVPFGTLGFPQAM